MVARASWFAHDCLEGPNHAAPGLVGTVDSLLADNWTGIMMSNVEPQDGEIYIPQRRVLPKL